MALRWASSVGFIGALLFALAGPATAQEEPGPCEFTARRSADCDVTGTIPGDEPTGEKVKKPVISVAPFRYLHTDGSCYWWSPDDTGLDTWDLANESAMYGIILNTPECVTEPLPDRAWRIFHSFPLEKPDPSLNPTLAGITGYPTYLAASNPATISHFEVLPSSEPFEVRAWVAELDVAWGDGWTLAKDPQLAVPYPDGGFVHIYKTKTCTPEYRETHVSGRNCHPTLEAYPITATFTWWGEYRINGGSWVPIGTLDLATTVAYDVDEVFGVLISPDR